MRKFHFLSIGMPPISVKLAGNGGFDVAGAIGSGLSFIGGLVTNSTNKKIAREQMAQQERLFNTQMDYTKAAEMRQYEYADKAWDREAAYNDPAAQKARFEAAGLNPALMMEGQNAAIGSAESVSAPSSPSPPSLSSYQVQDPITPAVQTFLQSRAVSAQARKTEEEANQLGIDNQTRALQNVANLSKTRAELWEVYSREDLNKEQKRWYAKLIDEIDDSLSFNMQTLDARKESIKQGNALIAQQIEDLKDQIVNRKAQRFIQSILAQSQIRLNERQIDSLSQAISESEARTKKEFAEELYNIMLRNNIDPNTPEGKRLQDKIQSEIDKNKNIWFIPGKVVDKTLVGWRKLAHRLFGW